MRRLRTSRWRYFDLCVGPAEVPRRGGLYALYDKDGRLLYIGSSGNVRTRVVEHLRKKEGVCFAKLSFMKGAWYRREQRLIRRLRPLLNLRITKRNFRNANC